MLTVVTLRARWTKDAWLSDGGYGGCGRLVARKLQDKVLFYFLYRHLGKSKRLALGPVEPDGPQPSHLFTNRDAVESDAISSRHASGSHSVPSPAMV
jgi:hypothetical protein